MKTEKRIRHLLFQVFFMSMLCMLYACSDEDNEKASVPEDWIQGLPESVSFKVNGGEQNLEFTLAEGVDASQIAYIMPEDAESWCNISIGNNNINIKVPSFGYSRSANITFIYDENHRKNLEVLQITDFSEYFKDDICSELKDGITEDDIANIPNETIKQLALKLKNGGGYDEFEKEFRIAKFRPYQNPEIMATRNKTMRYSLRDNVTGIWAKQGEEIDVMVGDIYEGGKIELMFHGPDKGYGNSKNVSVVKGFNRVIAPITGQIYVMNHVEDEFPLHPEEGAEVNDAIAAKTVDMHFLSGRVTRYIDRNRDMLNGNEKWKDILDKADYEFIDILGNYAHITWKTKQWREKKTDLAELIRRFDNIIYWEQDFAGLVKYNCMFNNRLHFCADYVASAPNASNYRTVYPTGADKIGGWDNVFYDLAENKRRLWVLAHESGHCNQLSPGMKWTGLGEVTNNIYCLYAQFNAWGGYTIYDDVSDETGYGPELAQCEDENGVLLPETGPATNYEMAKAVIVYGKRHHSLPYIEDAYKNTCKLVPFWQLYLYVVKARGVEDFYKDLFQHFRQNLSPSEKGENQGMNQLDFVRQACKYSGYDLTEFFEQWGFLKPVNALVGDYSSSTLVITDKDVEALKTEIKEAGYKKAHSDIYNITDKTWRNYTGEVE